MSAPTTPEKAAPRRSRRRLLLAVLLAALAVAGVAAWLVLRPSPAMAPAAAAPTVATHPEPGTYGSSVLPPSSPAAAPPAVPRTVLADVPGLPKALAPVALDRPVGSSDGVSARLVDIKAITAQAHGVGETSGPALAVIVELSNAGASPVSLDTVAVNMYLGATGTAATRIHGDSGLPFSGSLPAGASARAVYAFRVPTDQRDVVTVTVGHSAETGTAVFSGSVA